MRIRIWWLLPLLAVGLVSASAGQAPETRPAREGVEGVWRLEKIVRAAGSVDTRGGFIFRDGYYSTTVNYSQEGTQTNISQFGTYVLEAGTLSLLPAVQVSTRGETVIYQPEPPFSLAITITGDEMRGVAMKDGTTFVFRRLR